jgi:hypothetical protein
MFTKEGLKAMENIRNACEHYDEGAYLKNYKNMTKPDTDVENQPLCWKCQRYPTQCYANDCGKGSHFVAPETLGEGAKRNTPDVLDTMETTQMTTAIHTPTKYKH